MVSETVCTKIYLPQYILQVSSEIFFWYTFLNIKEIKIIKSSDEGVLHLTLLVQCLGSVGTRHLSTGVDALVPEYQLMGKSRQLVSLRKQIFMILSVCAL
jgi:hypothetical protein